MNTRDEEWQKGNEMLQEFRILLHCLIVCYFFANPPFHLYSYCDLISIFIGSTLL